jgi:hypothetical protein
MASTKMAACHNCNFQRSDLTIDDIPLTAPGLDKVCAEFFTDIRDVNINEVGERRVVLAKNMIIDECAGD